MGRRPCFLILLIACFAVSPAAAQQLTFVEYNVEGVITRVAPTAVEMRTPDGATRVIQLTSQGARRRLPPPVVEVSAPLRPAAIKPGMVAKFHAVVADGGLIEQPLSRLEVANVKMRKKVTPAVPTDPTAPLDAMLFLGEIKQFTDGNLTIAMKQGDLDAPVNAATKIMLQGADPKQVKPGDKIYARGIMQAVSMQPPIYFAQHVAVEMAEPLPLPENAADQPAVEVAKPREPGKRPTFRLEIRTKDTDE